MKFVYEYCQRCKETQPHIIVTELTNDKVKVTGKCKKCGTLTDFKWEVESFKWEIDVRSRTS